VTSRNLETTLLAFHPATPKQRKGDILHNHYISHFRPAAHRRSHVGFTVVFFSFGNGETAPLGSKFNLAGSEHLKGSGLNSEDVEAIVAHGQ